jgi:hypothetical protein
MSEVKMKGRRRTVGGGAYNHTVIYDYKSPGVNFPNESKKGEELAELSGGVTITQLSQEETEKYLRSRRIGKLSKIRRDTNS